MPVGAGLALTPVMSIISFFCAFEELQSLRNILIIGTILAIALSIFFFYDDLKSICFSKRLIIQFTSCIIISLLISKNFHPIKEIPIWLNFLFITIGFVGFLNMNNFVDGLDGLMLTHVICTTLSLMIITKLVNSNFSYIIMNLGTIIISVMFSFAIFNWHPAKVFIGDSGSVSIGFLLGLIIILNLIDVGIFTTIIICSQYLLDVCAVTCYRIYKKEKFWLAHSDFIFQRIKKLGIKDSKICIILAILYVQTCFFAVLSLLTESITTKILYFISVSSINFFVYLQIKRTKLSSN